MSLPLLEVCVASLGDALAAVEGGAGRVELNSALELGGLTPSPGLLLEVVEALRATPATVIPMIRPRPGGFCYHKSDLRVMQRDIALALKLGADGVALGVLTESGEIDRERCADLIAPVLEAGKEAVFHRAFDLTPNPMEAIEALIDLGFCRVLTSGQASSAFAGAGTIAALAKKAAGRIELLPGGGVRPNNVAQLMQFTGCHQLHGSLRGSKEDHSNRNNPELRFGVANLPPESQYSTTDQHLVARVVEAMRASK
ncbi:MAG: copper homeostasis protein CutC [Planctomycetota bacterium]